MGKRDVSEKGSIMSRGVKNLVPYLGPSLFLAFKPLIKLPMLQNTPTIQDKRPQILSLDT